MLITDLTIEEILPHRGRMKLIHSIIEANDYQAITLSIADSRWPLSDEKGIHPAIFIELIAQTAGIKNINDGLKKHSGKIDNDGWLVGVKTINFYIDIIPFAARLVTYAGNRYKYGNLIEITGKTVIENKTACEAVLQVFHASDDE